MWRGGRCWQCGGDGRSGVGAAGRERGRTAHPRPKSVSSADLHHVWAREGGEVEEGALKLGWR